MSIPTWTQETASQPLTIRSSFARPEESKGAHSPLPTTTATTVSRSRSGFTSKPKSKPRQPAVPNNSDLPPTLSIRSVAHSIPETDSKLETFTAKTTLDAHSVPSSTNTDSTNAHAGRSGDVNNKTTELSSNSAKPLFSVIVFGFPPGATQRVIQHFSQFGEISESSDYSASSVECGRNWLRIGYTEREAALKALVQNGQVMPGQYVIGCIPSDHTDQSGLLLTATNSLMLDDSDVSFVHDQSMMSMHSGEESREDSVYDLNTPSGIVPYNSSLSFTENLAVTSKSPEDTADRSQKPEELIAHEPVPSLFVSPKPKPIKPLISVSEKVSDKPQSTLGKIARRITDTVFGWDV